MGGVEYQVTKVDPTDPETKGMVYQVHKVSEEVAATLGGKVYRARIIKDPTEPTVAGKVYQIVLIDDPDDPSVKGKVYNAILTGGSEAVVVGPAVSPLALDDAVADSLTYVKAFGGTEQNGTPTPDAPIPIVCNNGTLDFRDTELPVGYRRLLGYTCNNNVLWQITDFHLRGSDTVRISFSIDAACNVFGCYQGTDATDNYDLYVSTTSGSKYLRYGNGTYLSYWSSSNLGERFDVVFTPSGSQGMPQDSTWTPMTFTSANDFLVGATTLTGTSAKLKGNLYGNIVVDGRLNLIPCERVSDNSLGYYDTYSETFFEPTGTPTSLGYDYTHCDIMTDGTVETISVHGKNLDTGNLDHKGYTSTGGTSTSSTFCGSWTKIKVKAGDYYTISFGGFSETLNGLFVSTWKTDGTFNLRQAIAVPEAGYWVYQIPNDVNEVNFTLYKTGGVTIDEGAWMQVEKGNTKTDYEPYYDGGTATAEMLLKVGDYQDEQEILTGSVTRNVKIIVFDGTETFTTSTAYGKSCLITSAASVWGANKNIAPVCTHFLGDTNPTSTQPDYTCFFNASGHFYFRLEDNTVATFKAWLAAQYAAGTPVILLVALVTPTTESVTGQTLQVTDGDNVLEITQASIDDLKLEAEYEKEA